MTKLSSKPLRGSLAAVILAGAVSACSGSGGAPPAPTVHCANNAIHGSGKYQDEVWVQVSVNNASSKSANYVVDVQLGTPDPQGSPTATDVTVSGLVAAQSSAVLSRKVLTVSQVQRCQIIRLSPS